MPKPKQVQLSQAIEKHDVIRALNSDSRTPINYEVRHLDGNLVVYSSLTAVKFPVASVTIIMSDKRRRYIPKAGEVKSTDRLKVWHTKVKNP